MAEKEAEVCPVAKNDLLNAISAGEVDLILEVNDETLRVMESDDYVSFDMKLMESYSTDGRGMQSA